MRKTEEERRVSEETSSQAPKSQRSGSSGSGGKSAPRRTSIVTRFNQAAILLYIGTLVVSLLGTYILTRQHVFNQAQQELELLEDMIYSVRLFVREETRQHFLDQNIHFPPVTVEALAPKLLANKFLEEQPDYYIRLVSDNPLNPENRAEPFELSLLQQFRDNPDLDPLLETGPIRGTPYLVASTPIEALPGCFQCHGLYTSAPSEITNAYAPWNGVNFRGGVGSIAGVSMVGVPLADVNALVIQRSLLLVALLTVLFAGIFLVINVVVKRSIVGPIVDISNKARDVSRGKVDQQIESKRKDEIGNLARSFELMRRSLMLAMKRVRG